MSAELSLDEQVRQRLRQWPQSPPGMPRFRRYDTSWLRARPVDLDGHSHPFLKMPGSSMLRTQPDGLWLHFAGSPREPYVDVFAIEACSSLPNFLDKRARFAPSTSSLMAYCPLPWLLGRISAEEPDARWLSIALFHDEPSAPLILPVRDLRVMYALTDRHYRDYAASHVPHPHEFVVPMGALIAEHSDTDPAMCALLSRATALANFLPVAI